MLHRVLADLVLVLHLAFIVFVVAGGLLALRWRWAPILHLPAACWGIFIELTRGICPLTPLENALRRAAGSSGYAGGFVEHYLVPLVYPDSLSHPVQSSWRRSSCSSTESSTRPNYLAVSRPEIDARRNAALRKAGLE